MKQSEIKVGGEYLQRQGSSYGNPRKVRILEKGIADSYGKKNRVKIEFLDEPGRWDRYPRGAIEIISSGQIRSTWAEWEVVLEQRAEREKAQNEQRLKDDRRTLEITQFLGMVGLRASSLRVSDGVPKLTFEGDVAEQLLDAIATWGEGVTS